MKKKQNKTEKFEEDIVCEVLSDFARRQEERKALERQWELNLNFVKGNQYCEVDRFGNLVEDGKRFFWQNRGVYNHVATLIDTRVAKLGKVKPVLAVKPASPDDDEINNARLAETVIQDTFDKKAFKTAVERVTEWSEYCGTGFYKIVWDETAGVKVGTVDGKDVYEGEVKVLPVSPFEIFPDSLTSDGLENAESVIHARAVSVGEIEKNYGLKLNGGKLSVFGSTLENAVLLIERYERPTVDLPDGRLTVVAGDKLLYYGALPYVNGTGGKRDYPFVMQISCPVAGRFFGMSVVERLIPVQRAYNAVKNRKHEFLNRLTMGVIAVEDGSVDTDDLEIDGLPPGKLIVYRQGTKPPEMISENALPPDFDKEEERLLNEFICVSGISNVGSNNKNAGFTSGNALELLIEQDNVRLTSSAEKIRDSYVAIAVQVLRLYREFLSGVKAVKSMGEESKTKVYFVDKGVLTSDDIYVVNENELIYSENQRRQMLLELYKNGMFQTEDGKMRAETKAKLLSLLGYADLDGESSLIKLHLEKAKKENATLVTGNVKVDVYDDHRLHIDEHTRYALSENENLTDEMKEKIATHVLAHKEYLKENRDGNGENE